jgi:predicted phage terminase large subunit-like protein
MDINKLEIEVTRKVYEESYYEFFVDAFAQLHNGGLYDENWHLRYIADQLQVEFWRIKRGEKRTKDIIINVPFRSSKSMLVTVIFPVWCWAIDPRFKFICVSYSSDLALEHAQLSKDLIRREWFKRYFGDKVKIRNDANSKEFYKTTADGYRKSVGTGGQITGSGADIIIIDDPQNPKLAASETERQNTINFHDHTLYSRLNMPDIGIRLIVMQRLHEGDLCGHLLDPETGRPDEYQHICIPGEYDENILVPAELKKYYDEDGLFWKTRFNFNTLKAYKRALGDLQYAGQIQQVPSPPEGSIWKRDWFEIVDAKSLTRHEWKEPTYFIMDTAYTAKQTNDPTGIFAYFIREGIMYVLNVAEAYKEFPELVEWTKAYAAVNDYKANSIIYVEPKASGKSVVQQLRSTTNLNVVEIESEMIKDDKLTRANAVAAIIQAGKVKLVKGVWNDMYLSQVTMFPNSKHDEFVDCTCYAISISLMHSNSMLGGML